LSFIVISFNACAFKKSHKQCKRMFMLHVLQYLHGL
jgi:hypothetical protein